MFECSPRDWRSMTAGDVFGWSAVVPPYRATSTAIAIEPSEVLICEARALRDALDEDEDPAPQRCTCASSRPSPVASKLPDSSCLDVFGRAVGPAW